MDKNPFKFGTIVDGQFFTDREDELVRISSYIKGENHLVMISPRRYGKTSLIRKVVKESGRKYIYLDLQLVFSPEDFASQLLKRVYRIFTMEKLKGFIKSFRLIPSVLINPLTGETEISFRSGSKDLTPLEDVLNLIGKLGSAKNRLIVVLDEFQEIFRIGTGLDRLMRSVIQSQSNINYIFLGSSESMIREIFEKKSSPFYRFGTLMTLEKIAPEKFTVFLEERFKKICNQSKDITMEILLLTGSHPFYTQQLGFSVWELLILSGSPAEVVKNAADEIVLSHDNDYERLWNGLNRTDMMILTGIASGNMSPLSGDFSKQFGTIPSSTVFSSLKRLVSRGLLIKENAIYIIDDPFFKSWILVRREI
ncbi:MAG: ATP-binding protein [Bacteroidales bacterium]